ncbi:MAG: Uma2 family endonuclease, partial [Cyanobacteria bacterium P01_F01_bin.116]
MTNPRSTLNTIIYPESDGQPMTESDATRDYLFYGVEALRLYFKSRGSVYVSGNLFIYYEEGNPKAVISPDVFVVFGVSQRKRRSYKTWQENHKLPSFVLEITSKTTKKQDQETKPELYASLGVEEYFQYDPTADYLTPQLQGARLVDGRYEPLPIQYTEENIAYIRSQILGLDLQLRNAFKEIGLAPLPKALRFYDPQTNRILPSQEEVLEERNDTLQALDNA